MYNDYTPQHALLLTILLWYNIFDYKMECGYLWLWNGNVDVGVLVKWKYGYIGIFWNCEIMQSWL